MKHVQHHLGALLLAAITVLALAGPADAVSTKGIARNVHYVVAFRPFNSMAIPFTGTMILTFNDGIVSGTYTDDSIKPGGPLANRRNVSVNGGVNGEAIHLTIGTLSFNGRLYGETIAGSAIERGRLYEFEAQQGRAGQKLTDEPTR